MRGGVALIVFSYRKRWHQRLQPNRFGEAKRKLIDIIAI
jgi:hypothetical protein